MSLSSNEIAKFRETVNKGVNILSNEDAITTEILFDMLWVALDEITLLCDYFEEGETNES